MFCESTVWTTRMQIVSLSQFTLKTMECWVSQQYTNMLQVYSVNCKLWYPFLHLFLVLFRSVLSSVGFIKACEWILKICFCEFCTVWETSFPSNGMDSNSCNSHRTNGVNRCQENHPQWLESQFKSHQQNTSSNLRVTPVTLNPFLAHTVPRVLG